MARVLIVEDDPSIATAMELALTMEGHEVAVEGDGQAGLCLARALPLPDVLLVDLLLPGLRGREIVQSLAEDPHGRAIPIIIITATARPDTFPPPGTYRTILRKPFDLGELLTAVADAVGETGPGAAP